MNKKTIAAFLGGIALTVAVSTAAPAIKDAVAPKVDAAGTCPITLQPIQSTGNLIFSPFRFYSSDLTYLRAELNDLGAWADGEISSINTEVTNGKVSLRTKMNSKGASLSTATIPSFAQLEAAVDDIYDKGWADHRDHMNSQVIVNKDNPSQNGGWSDSWTISHDGTLFVAYSLMNRRAVGMLDSTEAYVKINGTRLPGNNTGEYTWAGTRTVSAGDSLTALQPDWGGAGDDGGHFVAVLFY